MLTIVMRECGVSFVPREDGGKVMVVTDPASTISVELPIPEEACTGIAEWIALPNEELQARIDAARAASGITVAGASDLAELKKHLGGEDGRRT